MRLLDDIRVLDLAGMMGIYCTKQLADLGADVIRLEPPGGDPLRKIGPFYKDEVNPEKSLYFFLFNTNKRSITLNLEMTEGQEILRKLAKGADVVVETFPPGHLDKLGIGYDALSKINPRLILTSITGYGQSGPYRDYKACDITGVAMGGLMWIGGFPEAPPSYPGGYQGYYLASINGTTGTLMALYHRDMTGEGQHVDVSMQEAVVDCSELGIPLYTAKRRIRKRTGRQVYRGWNELFPCKDGYIMCSPFGGGRWKEVLDWANSEGMATELRSPRYAELLDIMGDVQMDRQVTDPKRDPRVLAGRDADIAHIEQVWESFLASHTKEELYHKCQSMRVRLTPIFSAADQLQDSQLLAREWFISVEHPQLGDCLTYPGPPYRFKEMPCEIRRAPSAGQHNMEVYQRELGFSTEDLIALKQEGVI